MTQFQQNRAYLIKPSFIHWVTLGIEMVIQSGNGLFIIEAKYVKWFFVKSLEMGRFYEIQNPVIGSFNIQIRMILFLPFCNVFQVSADLFINNLQFILSKKKLILLFQPVEFLLFNAYWNMLCVFILECSCFYLFTVFLKSSIYHSMLLLRTYWYICLMCVCFSKNMFFNIQLQ